MLQLQSNLIADESGATAIEYSLIVAFVAVAAIVTLQAMGTSLAGMFYAVSSHIDAAVLATSAN